MTTEIPTDAAMIVPDSTRPADAGLLQSWGEAMTWADYEMLVARTLAPFEDRFDLCDFSYVHPTRLQGHWPAHQAKDTPIRLSYTLWGDPHKPLVLCIGGIANTARRWDYLALGLSGEFQVACLDWAGRGMSAWMPTQGDYNIDTYVEQVRQLLDFLDCGKAAIVGSSLGGSVAIALCARHPGLVDRLILNDIGPYVPSERRLRRAQAVARHYVFRRPADLFRRLGASAKNEGPVTEDELLHNTYFQTKWSDANGGRIYRHDPRALQAYADEAGISLDQWSAWESLDMPVLVVHGMVSDALLEETILRMTARPGVVAMHVPDTGHTPALSDANQIHFLRQWLLCREPQGDFTCLNPPAPARHLFEGTPRKPASGPAPTATASQAAA